MDQSHNLLIRLLLIEKLILDKAVVDEVAHIRARVPSHIVGIYINFSQILDHFIRVRYICF